MTAKEFLKQYEYAYRKEQRLLEEYEKECELIDSVRSSAYVDGMPHSNNLNKSVEDRAIRLADKSARHKMARLDALETMRTVFDVIYQVAELPGDKKLQSIKFDILYYRYIDLMQWEELCVKIKYAWAQTHRLHAEALEDVAMIMKRRGISNE